MESAVAGSFGLQPGENIVEGNGLGLLSPRSHALSHDNLYVGRRRAMPQ
jgi:hypothetical protein